MPFFPHSEAGEAVPADWRILGRSAPSPSLVTRLTAGMESPVTEGGPPTDAAQPVTAPNPDPPGPDSAVEPQEVPRTAMGCEKAEMEPRRTHYP